MVKRHGFRIRASTDVNAAQRARAGDVGDGLEGGGVSAVDGLEGGGRRLHHSIERHQGRFAAAGFGDGGADGEILDRGGWEVWDAGFGFSGFAQKLYLDA